LSAHRDLRDAVDHAEQTEQQGEGDRTDAGRELSTTPSAMDTSPKMNGAHVFLSCALSHRAVVGTRSEAHRYPVETKPAPLANIYRQ